MNKHKLILYGIVPVGSTLVMVFMHFSGIELLRNIIAPDIEGLYGNSRRELGLLENLQNVVLVAMLVICGMGFRRKKNWLEKTAFIGVGCFTLLMLMEEIDYGLHYYEFVRGVKAQDAAQNRNLHNVGDRTQIAKQIGDVGLILLFVILPFALMKTKNRYVRYLLPDRYSVITLVGSFLVSSLAHWLNDRGFADEGVFRSNISEFREYQNYWLCMLYLRELAFLRRFDDPQSQEVDCASIRS